jgi:hypothetical protein
VLLPLAIAGAVVCWRRRITLVPIVAHVVVVTATAAVTFGVTRYRVPVDICEILLAAIAIEAWVSRRDRTTVDPSEDEAGAPA